MKRTILFQVSILVHLCFLAFFRYPATSAASTSNIRDATKSGIVRVMKSLSFVASAASAITFSTTPRVPFARAEDSSEFYSQWSYQRPDDFLTYVRANSRYGNVEDVRKSMENFSKFYPMYQLSREKVTLLQNTVLDARPKAILEIGTFFGYSALTTASSMPPGCTLTCIEGNAENARIASEILDRGLGKDNEILSRVKIIVGTSIDILGSSKVRETLLSWSSAFPQSAFDFVFLDHDKDCYLPGLCNYFFFYLKGC